MTVRKEVISIFVDNQANVLTRVAGLFGRRGFNIDSLTVSATNNPEISRITIVFEGDEVGLAQILAHTEKLEVVRGIYPLDRDESLFRELLLLKVKANEENRSAIREIVDIYRGRIVDLSKESMIIESTGAPEKIDGLMKMLEDYEILEVCRTGVTGILRGIHQEPPAKNSY